MSVFVGVADSDFSIHFQINQLSNGNSVLVFTLHPNNTLNVLTKAGFQ
jgi:hypothetical protein